MSRENLKSLINIKIQLNSKTFIIALALVYCIYAICYPGYNQVNNLISGILIIFINIYLAYSVRKNMLLVIISMCMLYFNYSIIMRRYIMEIPLMVYEQTLDQRVYIIGLNGILLFMIILLCLINHTKLKEDKYKVIGEGKNTPLVIVISILLIFILIFGFTRPSVVGDRGIPTPMYEYSIIFFIIGFSYVGNNILNKWGLLSIAIMFALQNIIYGGRITALQIIIIIYIMFFKDLISKKMTIYLAIMMFLVFTITGMTRGDWSDIEIILANVLEGIKSSMYTLDTADMAYFTSLTFIQVHEWIEIDARISQFFSFLISMVVGGGVDNANLAYFTRDYFLHYYGGVFPFFFYFWFGWLGVILSGIIVSIYMNLIGKINQKTSKYIKLLSIYIVATVPRWYLYAPTSLIRGVMLFSIVYIFLRIIHELMKGAVRGIE